jgi:hypothetical protein
MVEGIDVPLVRLSAEYDEFFGVLGEQVHTVRHLGTEELNHLNGFIL